MGSIKRCVPYGLGLETLPQVRGGALGGIDVDVDAGGELEGGLDGEAWGDVDVPVEVRGAAGGGAHPEVELGRAVEARGEQAQGGVEHRRARGVLGEARGGGAGDDAQLEGRARGPGADQR